MKGVILAGGEATRLRPLTCNTPKILVPVLNRPFLEHVVGYLKAHNILDIVLAVGKSPEQIQDHFGQGDRLGVRISYSIENFPLGTAGAVKNAQRFLDDSFFVFNGDVFTDIDLTHMMRLHRENKARVSLALTPVDNPTIYGVVETNGQGRVRHFVEKPTWERVTTNMINAGIYILEPDILSCIPTNTFSMFERDVFPLLVEQGQAVYGYPFHDYWIDVGAPDKYLKLHHDLLRRSHLVRVGAEGITVGAEAFVHSSAQIQGPVLIGEACFVDKACVIKGPTVLGARCHVEEAAVVEGAVLWPDCKVGRGAKLTNCLVASRCCIGEESQVLEGCVLGEDVQIERGSILSKGVKVWPGNTIGPGTVSWET
ncbi:MAG: sugar phosphate nucleotidyltransferase [Dehalococcoidia bacterium]